jgi:polyferredoxin
VALLSVLLVAVVLSMPWCRYLCPLGTALGILARYAPRRIVNVKSCTHCGQCTPLCPVGAIDEGRVDQSSCIYCTKCIGTCGFTWTTVLPGRTAPAADHRGDVPHTGVSEWSCPHA